MNSEPMTVEQIRELIVSYDLPQDNDYAEPRRYARLILAWAHERARGNELAHPDNCQQCADAYHEKDRCERYWWIEVQYLNEVLDEIGWPKEAR